MIRSKLFFVLLLSAILAGCGTTSKRGGGYYQDDGPDVNPPKNLQSIPNAQPRIERHAPANMRPYTVMGKQYVPMTGNQPFRQTGTASWYGKKFHGRKTANGEIYDMYAMTAAHPTLPLPSYAKVTRPQTGQSIIVRINDRGPFHGGRIIDLSYVAATKLGLIGPGSGAVIVEAITHDDIRTGAYAQGSPTPVTIQSPATMQPVQDGYQSTSTGKLTTISENSGVPQVYLQFGAFSAQQSANSLVDHLNQKISSVEFREAHVVPTNDLYRVQIGPYNSRTEALDAGRRIEQETGIVSSLAIR
ncbi:septal ring lytic transglycosylase RlpA family protein [Alcaligenaceae bacterium 429]|nr:septal ring lytic transglycosylase RlpA family protein [Alcaligenaceae bacterium 429]